MKKLFYSQKLAPYVFILPFVLTVIFFWAVPIAFDWIIIRDFCPTRYF